MLKTIIALKKYRKQAEVVEVVSNFLFSSNLKKLFVSDRRTSKAKFMLFQ
jgi:hypothetical protein